ncbi:MAG: glycosyltransferase family 2 protein [Burkholderiales bacterium]|nr:MAG: glycosyltransferase family 2 protein [Burkholderiales bacterium]
MQADPKPPAPAAPGAPGAPDVSATAELGSGTGPEATVHRVSIVVPLYNEEENIEALVARVHETLDEVPWRWELILVNDGSTDRTLEYLQAARGERGPHLRVLDLLRNSGQTAAMQAGIDAARGDIVVTLDGDLQNDPADIPRMVDRLLRDKLDLVAGWRRDRKDNRLLRLIPSMLANRLIRRVTRVQLHDYGCTLKVFRAEIIKEVRLYGEMHRFIPAWLAMHTSPSRIAEEVVMHHPRTRGTSKYGLMRTFRVLFDLLVVFFFMRYLARPGHFFGALGMVVGSIGAVLLGYLILLKLAGEDIGCRPLLLLAVLLVVIAIQTFTTGILSEMLSRIYFESQTRRTYWVRADAEPGEDDWHGR